MLLSFFLLEVLIVLVTRFSAVELLLEHWEDVNLRENQGKRPRDLDRSKALGLLDAHAQG